ncbi:MAG: hypothetical protein GX129_13205 [Clostridiales bacterium]|jgi:outer membrane lipopolysaccharide assembly protein LptE/RlpB|nr:hypothetical protein [Clostridiales bacterium]
MRDRVIALFIIIAMVCIIAACDKNIDNDIEVSTNLTEELQINEQNPDFGSINQKMNNGFFQ